MPACEPENFDIENVQIVLAEEPDYPAALALFHQGLQEGQVRTNDTGADMENLREAYFDDDGASAFWVAKCDEKVIGMIGVQKTADNAAEIRRLRVDEAYRRRGVGTLLMEQALAFCQRQGYLKVILDVRIERGPAIAMFEKFGFLLTRTRDIGGRKLLDFYVDLYSEPGH
jgi:ribosomal protein S18 acetylase RimI-like enzyme